mmetsp:Transcript_2263/g.8070  ORF Transcript_2263/g.8070 Transcript_2263/m.8070 type:complete len:453 (+) Transcript_2263:169-1527(+)
MSRASGKQRVCYFYDSDIGNYYYGQGHPMKPHRIRMAHNLLLNYGLYKKMEIYRPSPATFDELRKFHSDEYMRFLRHITPDNMGEYTKQMQRFNVGEDCPVFEGLYQFCQASSGGSIGGAVKLNKGTSDIAINWAGGLHHAKRSEASGFCYVNDIVLAILQLLKVHARVLYLDIDIHHGDGVEEAFYLTNRVMTLSFHQVGGAFFPGTGHTNDLGAKAGKNYSLNFPLLAGMDDAAYESIFKPVVDKVMEHFQPNAIVLCCGADSLSGDRVGCWNMSIRGHAACLEHVKSFGVPMLVLGGGGYTVRNVSRCWAYETARLTNQPISDTVPWHEYMDYYSPDYKLHVPVSNMENENTREQLEMKKQKLFEALSQLEHAPSTTMQTGQPGTRINPDALQHDSEEEEEEWDLRPHRNRRAHLAEYFDDDDAEGDLLDTDKPGREYEEPPSDDDDGL